MRKILFRFLSLFLCVMYIFFLTSCLDKGNPSASSDPVTITELNTPYNGNFVKVTAIEINTHLESNNLINVGFQFIIENTSEEMYFFTIGDFNAYINNSLTNIHLNNSNPNYSQIGSSANIAPGKQISIYFDVNTSVDAKVVELYFEEENHEGIAAIFKFDIPSVDITNNFDSADTTGNADIADTTDNVISTNSPDSTDNIDNTDLLTLEQYNQIQTGMTYDQVVEIFGNEGTLYMESGTKGTNSYLALYNWYGANNSCAILHFSGENTELQSKNQIGLK